MWLNAIGVELVKKPKDYVEERKTKTFRKDKKVLNSAAIFDREIKRLEWGLSDGGR